MRRHTQALYEGIDINSRGNCTFNTGHSTRLRAPQIIATASDLISTKQSNNLHVLRETELARVRLCPLAVLPLIIAQIVLSK